MNHTTLSFLFSASIIVLLVASQSYPISAHEEGVSTSSVPSTETPLPAKSEGTDCFFNSQKISVQIKRGGGGGSRGGSSGGSSSGTSGVGIRGTSGGVGAGSTTSHTGSSSSAATPRLHLSKLQVYSFIGYFILCSVFLL